MENLRKFTFQASTNTHHKVNNFFRGSRTTNKTVAKLSPKATTNLGRNERVEHLILQPIDQAEVSSRLLLFLSQIQRRTHQLLLRGATIPNQILHAIVHLLVKGWHSK